MTLYTVRVFDDLGGEARAQTIECAADGEAINTLLDMAGDKAAELWSGDRKVLWWPGRVQRPGGGSRRTPRRNLSAFHRLPTFCLV